ncbi:MAG: iron chelate uptake ABC transporter family permease subunit, partial [Cyanobacteria bacterium P01_D01_bin.73]
MASQSNHPGNLKPPGKLSKPWISIRPRQPRISFRVDRRVPLVMAVLVGVALFALVLNISLGEYPIPLLDAVKTMFGMPGNPDFTLVINSLRLPRALVALMVGAGLAVAGTISQAIA